MDHHNHNGECWYEIPIQLPLEYTDWLRENVPAEQIKEQPLPHITLLYGFDCRLYLEVDALVKAYNITPSDYCFGTVKRGSTSPVYLVPVHSMKLQQLFSELSSRFPNKHTLINGKFDPHVTLCWLHS